MAADAAQEVSVEVRATPEECFDAIVDFERYPAWSSAVQSAAVLKKGRGGIARVVEFHVDLRVKTVRYVLEYEHRKPKRLTWHSIDGDVESIEGSYDFRKRSANETEATCRQEVRLGFWIPGPIRKLAERTALRQSVMEFKEEVERRVASRSNRTSRRGRKTC
jgi:uncharacterized membrane protein